MKGPTSVCRPLCTLDTHLQWDITCHCRDWILTSSLPRLHLYIDENHRPVTRKVWWTDDHSTHTRSLMKPKQHLRDRLSCSITDIIYYQDSFTHSLKSLEHTEHWNIITVKIKQSQTCEIKKYGYRQNSVTHADRVPTQKWLVGNLGGPMTGWCWVAS